MPWPDCGSGNALPRGVRIGGPGMRICTALVLLLAAGAAAAQVGVTQPNLRLDPRDTRDCGSAVIQRCATPTTAPPEAREAEARRIGEAQALERVVIEGERLRGPAVERLLAERLGEGIVTPSDMHEITGNDGGRCTCMRRCPPFPFSCCNCSAPPDRPTRSF